MSKIIEVNNLSKKYQIREKKAYYSLRESIVDTVKKPFNLLGEKNEFEEFWALKEISFNVNPGEVVGIIGHNGAGKSTLLKILTRITPPTTGSAVLRGRVASLLEVGTGFHQELTGRENVYLNGAILGMTRKEITKLFDQIVEFSGIEKFIDTPVKQYSSGMQVRLGFSVAAHLVPDILLVDEILAVGDAQFQKKCLGKMEDVTKKEGRTILFVSHNMDSISRLCNRVIVLKDGQIVQDGETSKSINSYLSANIGLRSEVSWLNEKDAPGDNTAKFVKLEIKSPGNTKPTLIDIRKPIQIEITYQTFLDTPLRVELGFVNDQNIILFTTSNSSNHQKESGLYKSTCVIPGNFFTEGTIRLAACIASDYPIHKMHAITNDILTFQIIDKGEPGSVRYEWGGNVPGLLRPKLEWQTNSIKK